MILSANQGATRGLGDGPPYILQKIAGASAARSWALRYRPTPI